MKRKLVSILTALALVLSLCPTWALAAEGPAVGTAADLQAAITAAAASSEAATITLTADVDMGTEALQITGGNVTLDLAGHTLSGSGSDSKTINMTGGSLTVTNGRVENIGGQYGIYMDVYLGVGTLTVARDAVIAAAGNAYSCGIFSSSFTTVHIYGTVTGTYMGIFVQGTLNLFSGAVITGGTRALNKESTATVTLHDGAKAYLNGAGLGLPITTTGTGTLVICSDHQLGDWSNAGVRTCPNCGYTEKAVAEVAKDGRSSYVTDFSAAFAAENSGATITMLDNVSWNGNPIKISAGSFTLELNGKTITNAQDRVFYLDGGDLTVSGDGSIISENRTTIYLYHNDSDLTVNGGTIRTNGSSASAIRVDYGTVTVKNGHIISQRDADEDAALDVRYGSADIHGGTFTGGVRDRGTTKLYGGVFESVTENGVSVRTSGNISGLLGNNGEDYYAFFDGSGNIITGKALRGNALTGTVQVLPCSHPETKYEFTDTTHRSICTVCGQERSAPEAHTFDNDGVVCTVCGYALYSVQVRVNGGAPVFHATLDEAWNAATAEGVTEATITLLTDVSAAGDSGEFLLVPTGKTVTLLGSGHAVSRYGIGTGDISGDEVVSGSGALNIQNCVFREAGVGVTGGKTTLTGCTFTNAYVGVNGGTAELTGCTFTDTSSVYVEDGTATFTGCTFTDASSVYVEGGTATFTDCTFTETNVEIKSGAATFEGCTFTETNVEIEGGTVTLEGCKMSAKDPSKPAIIIRDGTAGLTNCEITASGICMGVTGGEVTINSGTYTVTGNAGEALFVAGNHVKLRGGTFSGPVTAIFVEKDDSVTLADLLGHTEDTRYAYYQDGDRIVPPTGEMLTGTVTVGECTGHEIHHMAGAMTHSSGCEYCGLPADPQNCAYTFEGNTGTCAACGDSVTVAVSGTENLVYDGTEKTLEVAVTQGETALTAGTDYKVAYSDNKNAGENKATVAVTIGNQQGTYTENFSIGRATPTITWSDTTQELTYTGKEAAITEPTVTLVNGEQYNDKITYSYRKQGETEYRSGLPIDAGTYTIKAHVDAASNYTAADSGEMALTINPSPVTLTFNNQTIAYGGTPTPATADPASAKIEYSYVGTGATTGSGDGWPVNAGTYTVTAKVEASGNYGEATATATLTINKAAYTGTKNDNTSGKYGMTKTYDLADLQLPAGYQLGAVSVTDSNGIFRETPTVSGTKLTYKLVDDSQKKDSTGTITIPVTSTNYEEFRLTITVTVLDKYAVTLDVPDITVTYGQTPEIQGTATGNGQTLTGGTWSFKGTVPTGVPGDTVTVVFEPADADKENYQFPVEKEIRLNIEKAPLTAEARSYTIMRGSSPPDFVYTVSGLVNGDKLEDVLDTDTIQVSCDADGQTAGRYDITVSGGTLKSGNYELTYQPGTLTVETPYVPPVYTHTHNWSTEWSSDSDGHWHVCLNSGCDIQRRDYAVHVYDDEQDTTCNVCGYVREVEPPEHVHDWASAWSMDDTRHWHECLADGCEITSDSGKDGYGAHVYDDEQDEDCNICGHIREAEPPETYTITYSANGGSGTMADSTISSGEAFTLPGCGFTPPEGKVFDAWAIGSPSGERAGAGSVQTFTADTALYALWKDAPAVTYTVTYSANGGTGTAPTMTDMAEGSTFRLPDSPFSRAGYQFSGWSYDGVIYAAGTMFTMPDSDVTFTAQWTRFAYAITGNVLQNGTGVPDAIVTLMRGTQTVAAERTDANGRFTFRSVPVGTYNLRAEKDGITKTVKQEITSGNADMTIILPNGRTNSVVEVKDEETPPVVVGGLEQVFTDTSVYTPEDQEIVNDGGAVEFKLTVEKQDAPPEAVQIEAVKKDNETVALYLDLTLTKTVTHSDGTGTSAEIPEVRTLIETIVPLPAEMQGKASYTVYRVHNGVAEPLPENSGSEYYTVSSDKTSITIFARKYSTYAIAWSDEAETPPTPPTPSRPTGGGSSVSTYAVTIEKSEHGKVTSSRTNASSGGTVTLTVTPDSGYVLDTLTVTDSRDTEIKLAAQGDGKYTFTMPSRAVTVKAVFLPLPEDVEQPCDGGAACPSHGFTDLGTVGTWYHEAVDYVLRNGLMNGYSSTLFGPGDNLSRAQLAQILYNQAGRFAVTGGSVFTDVLDGKWYAPAITWAAATGIVGGYGNGMFGPDDNITREQLAVMLWRYAGSPAATDKELHFTDADEASGYALEALRWAAENGVLNGYGDGRLEPGGLATRAQAAQMLMNFFGDR